MKKILITGATSGIGLETAKALASNGHHLLLHGRSQSKLDTAASEVQGVSGAGPVATYLADLSDMNAVRALADQVRADHDQLDVLINNAGVLRTSSPRTPQGHDVRFVVNTFAPVLLTRLLLPILPADGRVVNLSSAAQNPVNLAALAGGGTLDALEAYAQSKLALTIWSRHLGTALENGPLVVAVNPGSLLGTSMVREGFGVEGKSVSIGANVLVDAATSDKFDGASGRYFDNDSGRFANPHPHALDPQIAAQVVEAIETELNHL